jgi:hypothetical protein
VPVTGTVTLTSGGGRENRYPAGTRVTFERISGHRDGGRTACPGQALYNQLPALRSLAAARSGGSTGVAAPAGTVTLRALSSALRYPEPARLSGSLTGGGQVWVQVAAGPAYRTIARVQPAAAGTWAAEVPLTRGYVFRALQVLPDGSHGAVSVPVRVSLRPGLRASAPRRVLAGSAATVRGAIAPQQGRVTASSWIQGRSGRFHFVRRAAVRPSRGRFAVRVRLTRPGLYRLRLRFAGSRYALPASAPDLYVRAVRSRRSLSGGAAGPRG